MCGDTKQQKSESQQQANSGQVVRRRKTEKNQQKTYITHCWAALNSMIIDLEKRETEGGDAFAQNTPWKGGTSDLPAHH